MKISLYEKLAIKEAYEIQSKYNEIISKSILENKKKKKNNFNNTIKQNNK